MKGALLESSDALLPASQPMQSTASPAAVSLPLVAVLVVTTLALYLYPVINFRLARPRSPLPPRYVEFFTYLAMTDLASGAPGQSINPWFGAPFTNSANAYSRFGASFKLFHAMQRAVGGDWFYGVLLWNAAWTLATVLCAIWFFQHFVRERGPLIFAVLLFSVCDVYWLMLSLAVRDVKMLTLPLIRTFFPQTTLPFALLFLGLLLAELFRPRTPALVGMLLLQWLAFITFPYAGILLAGATFFALLLGVRERRTWLKWLLFGAGCGIADVGYYALTGPFSDPNSNGGMLQWSAGLFLYLLKGKIFLGSVAVAVIVALWPERNKALRAVLAGLGLAEASMMLADAFASPTLQIGNHGYYFAHFTFAILIAYLAAGSYERLKDARPRFAAAGGALAVALVLLIGVLAATVSLPATLPDQMRLADESEYVRSQHLGPDTLVIARSRWADDTSSWIPLVSGARVLFSRSAEFLLDMHDREGLNRERRAQYLYFAGWNEEQVNRELSNRAQAVHAGVLDVLERPLVERAKNPDVYLAPLRRQLNDQIHSLECGDEAAMRLFGAHRQLLVIDEDDTEPFSAERLSQYVVKQYEVRNGAATFRYYAPRTQVLARCDAVSK